MADARPPLHRDHAGDQPAAGDPLLFIIHPFIGFWRRMGLTVTYVFLTVFYLGSMVGLYLIRDTLLGRDLGTSLPLALDYSAQVPIPRRRP